jgi:hypothetical protein
MMICRTVWQARGKPLQCRLFPSARIVPRHVVPQSPDLPSPENWGLTVDTLNEKLAARPLQPCGSQDMASRGWSSPTKDDRFVLAVGGHFLVALAVEQKLLPSSVVNEVAADKAEPSRPSRASSPAASR